MKPISNIIFLSFLLLAICCKKDKNQTPQPPVVSPTQTNINIQIVGTVVDDSGNGIAGVALTAGNIHITSDARGLFVFENVTVPENRFYILASKNGFFESGYSGKPASGNPNYVRIRLTSNGIPSTINASFGGTVTANNGAKIIFPPNAFETLSGSVYNGTVQVFLHHISPDNPSFSGFVPGNDLVQSTSNSELQRLYSYGILGVSIQDIAGISLKIAQGKSAEIRFPIGSSQISSAPLEVGLNSFDSNTGTWKEDGLAVKSGVEYVGNVNHFSWWNSGASTGILLSTIYGRVIDCNGIPVAGIELTINGQYTAITDNQGLYSCWTPAGTSVDLQVFASNNCNISTTSLPVSVFTFPGSNNAPDLVIGCPTYVSGQIVDCQFTPTLGYIRADWSSCNTNLIVASSGNFVLAVVPNQSCTLQVFQGQIMKDTVIISGNQGTTLNIGTLSLCSSVPTGTCSGGQSTVADIDGNIYNIIEIGNQCWMKENLKTSRYQNGDSIATGLTNQQWNITTIGACEHYNDQPFNGNAYGKLYNGYATADPRKVCPTGWHVPSDSDWKRLVKFLDPAADTAFYGYDNSIAGGEMKEVGGYWASPNLGATNSSGFSGRPGGYRSVVGTYINLTGAGYWWSSTGTSSSTLNVLQLSTTTATTKRYTGQSKTEGYSIRCVRD